VKWLALKLFVMFVCMKSLKKEKVWVVIRMISIYLELAKLLRQTVKFLANEESVTDADRQ